MNSSANSSAFTGIHEYGTNSNHDLSTAVVSRCWAKTSACRLRVSLSSVPPLFVQVVSSTLGWSPLSSFRAVCAPSGDA